MFDESYIQSLINIKKPHKPLLPYLNSLLIFPQFIHGSVLIFGLGGGACVHMLKKNNPSRAITVVEKYSDMIHIAKRFFKLNEQDNVHILCHPAEEFIANTTCHYQHIIVDIGDREGFPKSCKNEIFFQNIYHRLTQDGVLILNLAQFNELIFFKNLLLPIFNIPPLVMYDHGNWILAQHKQDKTSLLNILKTEQYIKHYSWKPQIGDWLELRSPLSAKIRKILRKLTTLT